MPLPEKWQPSSLTQNLRHLAWMNNDPIVHGLVLYSVSAQPLSLSKGFTLLEETDVILHTTLYNHLLGFGNQTIVDIPVDETIVRMVTTMTS